MWAEKRSPSKERAAPDNAGRPLQMNRCARRITKGGNSKTKKKRKKGRHKQNNITKSCPRENQEWGGEGLTPTRAPLESLKKTFQLAPRSRDQKKCNWRMNVFIDSIGTALTWAFYHSQL